MPAHDVPSLIDAYCKKDFAAIAAFIKAAPETTSTENSVTMVNSNDSFFAVCGLDGMAAAYTHGSNYKYGLLFGRAMYECVHHYCFASAEGRKEEMLYYAASSSYLVTKSYLDTARYDEGIHFYEKAANDFGDHFSRPEFISLQLNAVELYLGTDQLEAARRIFQKISADNIPFYSRINYNRLDTKLKSLFRAVSVTPDEAEKTESDDKQAELEGLTKAWEEMFAHTSSEDPEARETLARLMSELTGLTGPTGDGTKETFKHATGVYGALNDYLKTIGGGSEESNLAALRMQLHQCQAVFLNEATAFDATALQQALHALQQLLPKFENKYADETNTTLWSIHICQKRLELSVEGAATLEQLRKSLECKRGQIRNEQERAGVFKTFPYLFHSLVELCYQNGSAKGVLKAIEASKGRLLADAIAEQTSSEIKADDYELPVDKLPALLSINKAAYISFFTDDDYTVSSLVTSNGRFYAAHIPVGKTTIHQWVDDHLNDPKEWERKGVKGLFSKKTVIPQLLEQFLTVLHVAIKDGNLAPGDHLVYSPDDLLFLFPLQYALFDNKYLIEQFSLSKIHGAYQLIHILEQPAVRQNTVVCCTVPAVDDTINPEKVAQFSEVKSWLRTNLNGITISEKNTIEEIVSGADTNSVIHFSTHGIFPVPGVAADKGNPYDNSGLLLKDSDKLPKLDEEINYYGKDYFLNPKKLFESHTNWQDSHITFQACVSARSKEGVGGDALGMESAAFFCGATSLLTAGWDISIDWANRFCIRFYKYWLQEKLNRAEAYQKAMLELMKAEMPSAYPAPYYWAGIILSGDWR